jgi:hypothetical protein
MGPFCNPLNWEWVRQREEQIASQTRRRQPSPDLGRHRRSDSHGAAGEQRGTPNSFRAISVVRVDDVPSTCETVMNRGVRSMVGPLEVLGHMEALIVYRDGTQLLISDRCEPGIDMDTTRCCEE